MNTQHLEAMISVNLSREFTFTVWTNVFIVTPKSIERHYMKRIAYGRKHTTKKQSAFSGIPFSPDLSTFIISSFLPSPIVSPVPLCLYPIMPLSHYASIPLCLYPIMPLSHYASIPICLYPIMPLSHYASIPLYLYTIMPIPYPDVHFSSILKRKLLSSNLVK